MRTNSISLLHTSYSKDTHSLESMQGKVETSDKHSRGGSEHPVLLPATQKEMTHTVFHILLCYAVDRAPLICLLVLLQQASHAWYHQFLLIALLMPALRMGHLGRLSEVTAESGLYIHSLSPHESWCLGQQQELCLLTSQACGLNTDTS